MPIKCTCQQCGSVFERFPSVIRKGGGKYCSRHCQQLASRRRVQLVCPACNTTFSVSASVAKRGRVHCSVNCQRPKVSIHSDGYRQLWMPDHPNAHLNGYILEHRFVMAESIGRPLRNDEVVHHRNGDKQDNRLENLQILSHAEHSKFHNGNGRWSIALDACIECGSSQRKHHARGYCIHCYEKQRYRSSLA